MRAETIQIILYSRDPKLHSLLPLALRPECSIVCESSKERLNEACSGVWANVIVLDFDSNCSSLPEQLDLCDQIADCPIPIIVMTDGLRHSTAMEFIQRGAFDCIRKPPSLLELRVTLRRAHAQTLMKAELDRMRRTMSAPHGCDQLAGASGPAQVGYDLIRRVANLNAFVLVVGESGTGKELVARAIHNLGNRAAQPFLAVSCGAIPESLMEAELFGPEKGAFTGSTGARAGYLEQAGGGTLFLDEIGELSLNTQVKLLRVLQEKEFCGLGSGKRIPLYARTLLATHQDLRRKVEAGMFRHGLFFRVNVMQIHAPALRERTQDIPTLPRHFLRKYSNEYDKPVNDIRPDAMELLEAYGWPGNVGELENLIQGVVILTDGDSIARSDLPAHLQAEKDAHESLEKTFDELLRQFRIDLADKAVAECDGNKTLAARKLSVSRAYLHRLIRKPPESSQSAA